MLEVAEDSRHSLACASPHVALHVFFFTNAQNGANFSDPSARRGVDVTRRICSICIAVMEMLP
jgi:hypothetical protein